MLWAARQTFMLLKRCCCFCCCWRDVVVVVAAEETAIWWSQIRVVCVFKKRGWVVTRKSPSWTTRVKLLCQLRCRTASYNWKEVMRLVNISRLLFGSTWEACSAFHNKYLTLMWFLHSWIPITKCPLRSYNTVAIILRFENVWIFWACLDTECAHRLDCSYISASTNGTHVSSLVTRFSREVSPALPSSVEKRRSWSWSLSFVNVSQVSRYPPCTRGNPVSVWQQTGPWNRRKFTRKI